MSDKLGFLDGEPSGVEEGAPAVETEAPAPEAQAEASEPAPERPRGPDGKFAPKAEAEAAPPPKAADSGHVPIGSLLDEREKRQALERQLADLKARAEPVPAPSEADQVQAAPYGQNLRASRRFAEREYGKDTIATVHDWAAARCDADPAFNQQMRSSDDPYEAAYQAYAREQVLAEVKPGELDAFKAWKAAQAAAQAQTPPAAANPPPRSLANASGTGAVGKDHVPTGDGNAYAAAFPT